MNILFLSVYEIRDSDSGYIYADLIREFSRCEHKIYAVTPTRVGKTEFFIDGNGIGIIAVKNGQIQKTSKIKKVLNLLTLEKKTIKAVKKYAKGVKFDLIVNMCSNLCYAKTSAYFKKRYGAKNYLLLKDIFPQNAVDIGMMKTNGLMGFAYRYFRKKEQKMYKTADYIGCMSQGNVEYIANHNPEIDRGKLTVVPNSIEPRNIVLSDKERAAMRNKYGIPQDKIAFVYGGNLGKPQSIPFIIDCLRTQKDNSKAFFLIVGDGTEYCLLEHFVESEKFENVKLMKRMPREDFDIMIASCDVGLIFLDFRFTVPNYPSRLLSYMQAGVPVLACTDKNTDIGQDIVRNKFGWWCESDNVKAFDECVKEICDSDLTEKGIAAKRYLDECFTVVLCCKEIVKAVI